MKSILTLKTKLFANHLGLVVCFLHEVGGKKRNRITRVHFTPSCLSVKANHDTTIPFRTLHSDTN